MAGDRSFLIIEDDEIDRKKLCRLLKNEIPDSEVIETDSCEKGLFEMGNKAFDCILLDYHLPDSNGIEFLQN